MKWTTTAVEELTQLCRDGVSNKALAQHFEVPVTEIYAKRSQLGITVADMIEARTQYEDKKSFVSQLSELLSKTGIGVLKAYLMDENTVRIEYLDGSVLPVNIALDSKIAIIRDVAKALQ